MNQDTIMKFTSPLFAVALLAALPNVKADQECVRGTVVFQSEKFGDYLSVNGNHPFINNYITSEMMEGTVPWQYEFARMKEVPCLAAAEGHTCPGDYECVSFQSARNPKWYMSGAVSELLHLACNVVGGTPQTHVLLWSLLCLIGPYSMVIAPRLNFTIPTVPCL